MLLIMKTTTLNYLLFLKRNIRISETIFTYEEEVRSLDYYF